MGSLAVTILDEVVCGSKDYYAQRGKRGKREDRGNQTEKRVSTHREENHNRPRSMWSSLQTVQLG